MSSYMAERRSNPALRKDEKKDGTDWQQMLGLMALGQGANAQTMLGFALGKLLREMWDHHLAARRAKQAQPTAEQISKIEHPNGTTAQPRGCRKRRPRRQPGGFSGTTMRPWSARRKIWCAMRARQRAVRLFRSS